VPAPAVVGAKIVAVSHATSMGHRPPSTLVIWAYRGTVAATPPDDPDAWTEEEWLAWLADVDAEAPPAPGGHPVRRARSVGVTLMGAAMLGMQRAIYGDSDDPDIVMVVDADGDPPGPEELEVRLDPEDPDASTVTVRPWLHEQP